MPRLRKSLILRMKIIGSEHGALGSAAAQLVQAQHIGHRLPGYWPTRARLFVDGGSGVTDGELAALFRT